MVHRPMPEQPRRMTLFGLALVTASALAQQVVLTRVYSSVLAYHFSFLAISLSLLGTGAGALAVYLWPKRFAGDAEDILARWTLIFAAALVLLPLILVHLDLVMFGKVTLGFVVKLVIGCVAAAIPPFASGVVVAVAISRFASSIGVVYAADLIGAGLGALLAVPLLSLGPAPNLLVGLGVVTAAAALCFTTRERGWALTVVAAGLVLLALAATTRVLYLEVGHFGRREQALGEHWTPLTRAFSFRGKPGSPFGAVVYDLAYAPVPYPEGEDLPGWEILRTGPQSIGYELTGPGHALIIGGGGGRDIYTALSLGQRVDVIELNEAVVRVVDGDLGRWSGKPYSRDGVSTVLGDGRSMLAARDTKYDQIHLGFTDTLSASVAQGFAMAENNLYTIEAFEEYLDHLRPRGILNVSRLFRLVGEEALRIAVLAQGVLEARGIDHPRAHMVVIRGQDFLGPPTGTVLLRLEPFTDAELDLIEGLAGERGVGVVYGPRGEFADEWKELADAPSVEAFCSSYYLDVCPPTDDRPFFFNMDRLTSLTRERTRFVDWTPASPFLMLLLTFAILLALSIAAFVAPLWFSPASSPPPMSALWYFWFIGIGFMLIEITLIQRLVLFLGFPTYALSVVLFSLLVFSGLGSYVTSYVEPRTGTRVGLAAAVFLIVVAALGMQPLLRLLIGLPLAVRVVLAVVLVAPVALCLGVAMPYGLQRLEGLYAEAIPYAWGVNGIASVLASVFGVVVAMSFGFTVAGLVAAVCYAAAWLHAEWGEWPAVASE